MAFSFRKAAGLASYVPTALVLAGLVALWAWGARSGWQLDGGLAWWRKPKPDEGEAGKRPAKEEDVGALAPLELSSDAAADKAGFELGQAKRRSVPRVVRATGVLAFDQTRYAHLSARAPGTAWRVLKGVGDPVGKDEVLALVASAEAGKAKADFLKALVQVDER